jgi:hypothetical protein
METDKVNTYKHLVSNFYKLYPDKTDTVKICDSIDEINSHIKFFCNKLRDNSQYFQFLLKKNAKLFKGLKCTLLPKIKMEVVLTNDDQSKTEIINEMWKSILLLYILGEAESTTPDKMKMAQVAALLDLLNSENNSSSNTNTNNENKQQFTPEMFKAFDMDTDKLSMMMQSMGMNMDVSKIDEFKNNLNSEQFTDLMTQFNKPPTEKSHQFINNILTDIRTKFNLTEREDGKVDAKQFVSQLMNIGNNLGDSYSKKLGKELDVSDIIGAISSIATNPDGLDIGDLSNTLKLDKLDIKETVEALKEEMKGKVPEELLNTLSGLDGENLKNINIGSILSSVMGGGTQEPVRELTEEERTELLKYYESLDL